MPPGATVAEVYSRSDTPGESTTGTVDTLTESGPSRPGTHGFVNTDCFAFYIDGLTQDTLAKKGLASARTQDEMDDGVAEGDLEGGKRIMSKENDLRSEESKPSNFGGNANTPRAYFWISVKWRCCCADPDSVGNTGDMVVHTGSKLAHKKNDPIYKFRREGAVTTDTTPD